MWLTDFLRGGPSPDAGQISPLSYAEGREFGAVADCESRTPPLFGPGPCGYLPSQGDRLLMLRCHGADVCAGIACDTAGLRPGELRLGRPGGGYILIRQNGEVVINGLRVSPDGQLIPPTA